MFAARDFHSAQLSVAFDNQMVQKQSDTDEHQAHACGDPRPVQFLWERKSLARVVEYTFRNHRLAHQHTITLRLPASGGPPLPLR